MSTEQLQEIADRVIAQARSGEQVEAFVSRDSETDIRVYEGSVEHFVSAQSEGIGIRVIRDGGRRNRYRIELDEKRVDRISQFLFDRGNRQLGGHRWRVLLKLRQGITNRLRQPLVDVTGHLAEFHHGASVVHSSQAVHSGDSTQTGS